MSNKATFTGKAKEVFPAFEEVAREYPEEHLAKLLELIDRRIEANILEDEVTGTIKKLLTFCNQVGNAIGQHKAVKALEGTRPANIFDSAEIVNSKN